MEFFHTPFASGNILWKKPALSAWASMAQNGPERNGFQPGWKRCIRLALVAFWGRKPGVTTARRAPGPAWEFLLVFPQIATLVKQSPGVKKALRDHMAATCSEQELRRWFDPLDIDRSEGEVRVRFPHSFFAQWFAGRMQDQFEAELFRFLGHNGCDVRYLVGARPAQAPQAENDCANGSNGAGAARPAQAQRHIVYPFDAQYSFDSFLTNSKNYFPLETARQVARGEDAQFNPFVICGKSGSGKSHLLKAIANDIAKRHPLSSILVTSGEGLKDLFKPGNGQENGQANNPERGLAARQYLSGHGFLLVDDIHWLAGDQGLQHELLTLFNLFQDQKKQMVFTCADRVAAHEDLLPALRSRLEGGLVVTLKQPDLEIRAQFVLDRVRAKKLPLSKEQVLTLAQRFQNFRALGGILIKLLAFRELVRKDISARDFEQILMSTEERDQPAITPDTIISVVCEHYQVGQKDVLGEDRRQNIALARQVAMWLCRQMLGLSYPALGRAFGGKDHSTVIYSVKKIEDLQTDDKTLKQLLKELKVRCRQP